MPVLTRFPQPRCALSFQGTIDIPRDNVTELESVAAGAEKKIAHLFSVIMIACLEFGPAIANDGNRAQGIVPPPLDAVQLEPVELHLGFLRSACAYA